MYYTLLTHAYNRFIPIACKLQNLLLMLLLISNGFMYTYCRNHEHYMCLLFCDISRYRVEWKLASIDLKSLSAFALPKMSDLK